MQKLKLLWMMLLLLPLGLFAQEDSTVVILDDIQFDVGSVQIKADTAIIDLFLISYQRKPREFKMNTFASLIVDAKDNEHFYSTIKMNRVFIRLEDRQNYLNHILEFQKPIGLQFKVANWKKEYGKPQAVKIVFEDSGEEGKYRELKVYLK